MLWEEEESALSWEEAACYKVVSVGSELTPLEVFLAFLEEMVEASDWW